MGITRTDNPKQVRIESSLLHTEPIQPGFTHITPLWSTLGPTGNLIGEDLKIRPLVVRREEWMGIRCTLHLCDFNQGFVAHSLFCVIGIQGLTGKFHQIEHIAI